MLVCTSWKTRPLAPDQTDRMMAVWGKIEADTAARTDTERLCWYAYSDGSGGFTVSKLADGDDASRFSLEIALALAEFLELDSRTVLDLDGAMPAIAGAIERMKG